MVSEPRRSLGLATRSTVATWAGVVLLSVLVGTSGGTPVTPVHLPTTLGAPFNHAQRYVSSSLYSAGCGVPRSKSLTFLLKTGNGSAFVSGRAPPGCTATGSGNYAESSDAFGLSMRLPKLGGLHWVFVNWTVRAAGAENITFGTCTLAGGAVSSSCSQYAAAIVSGEASLEDLTTAQNFDPNSSTWAGVENESYRTLGRDCASTCFNYNFTSTGAANQSFSVSVNASFAFLEAFRAGQNYSIATSWDAYVYVYYEAQGATLSGGMRGSASVTLLGPSEGATLDSITVL